VKNIVWLTSYPKSGNTWFRVFLINLLFEREDPADINRMVDYIPNAGARAMVDEALGFDSADLSYDESETLRADYYRFISSRAKETLFFKLHDANTLTHDGNFLIPPQATRGVIYLIRNPLDVVVSYANHSGIGIDESIAFINNNDACLHGDQNRSHFQFPQRLLNWSNHVRGWVEAENMDVHVIRFEDMKRRPFDIFSEAVRFIACDKTPSQIKKALDFSDIKVLQRQENERGFVEKPSLCHSFFHKGEIGNWKNILPPKQVKRVVEANKEIMTRFGYLDKYGEPRI
jgi:hypothetical protein